MSRIVKSERVGLYCEKHKQITEHMVYLKDDGKEVIRCLECSHEKPYAYPLYGRQTPKVSTRVLEESKPQQYGRQVA